MVKNVDQTRCIYLYFYLLFIILIFIYLFIIYIYLLFIFIEFYLDYRSHKRVQYFWTSDHLNYFHFFFRPLARNVYGRLRQTAVSSSFSPTWKRDSRDVSFGIAAETWVQWRRNGVS